MAIALSSTAVYAQSNNQLVTIASKQETLSCTISKAYKRQDSSSLLSAIKTLESGQKQLKSQISNPEISNLLVYLNLCLKDLKTIVKKPYSSKNAQRVTELSASISEGSRYIVASL